MTKTLCYLAVERYNSVPGGYYVPSSHAIIRARREGSRVMRSMFLCLFVIGLLVLSTCVWASVSGPLTVKATSGGKVASLSYDWSGDSYNLLAPVSLKAGDGTVLGMLNGLSCGMGADPFLTLNFAVEAVGDTNFMFDTGVLSFPTISPAMAFATAATTLTADGNGATFVGNFVGKGYEATYNGGTVFADLDSSFVSPADTSTTESERQPVAGFAGIGVPVSSIRAQWDFTLSGGDSASGTSRFDVEAVPDANTFVLAFVGAAPLLAGWVVRRRATA